jgi:serine/threonine protein kinase
MSVDLEDLWRQKLMSSPDGQPEEERKPSELEELGGKDTSGDTQAVPPDLIGRRTSEVMNIDPDYLFLGRVINHPRTDCTPALEKILQRDSSIAPGAGELTVRLSDKLGKGGMGQVYLGRIGQETTIAVKILDATTNSELVDRFNREKEISHLIASDGDPNIVQIYGSGETNLKTCDGFDKRVLYIFMEYIKHEDLNSKVARIPSVAEIPIPEMTSIMKQVARALEKVHTPTKGADERLHTIIHRDVNPNNIFVNDQGVAKLADVGIGKDITGGTAAETAAGFVQGTPAFMSPEQAKGAGDLDDRSDVYSWGSTFYFLLTKTAPYSGRTPLDIVTKVRQANKPLNVRAINKHVPVKLAEIIEVCTAPDRNDRFHSDELAHALELYDKAGSYTHQQREEIIKSTKAKFHFGKRKKEELENLIKAHEQAFWFCSGKERKEHQEKVIDYFNELELSGDGVSKDARSANIVIRKLRKEDGELTEEEEPIILTGYRFRPFSGKNKAKQVLEYIQDAKHSWEGQEYQAALENVTQARKEYRDIKSRWQRKVKDEIDKFHALLDGSIKAKQAEECFRQCKEYANQSRVEEAKKAFIQGEELLCQIPEVLAKYGIKELENKQVDHVTNVKKPEAQGVLDTETNMYNIDQWLGTMEEHISRENFSSADDVEYQIQMTLPTIPITDRARRLRYKFLEMKDAKEKAKQFYTAKKLLQGAVADMKEKTDNSYLSAQRKLDKVEGITSEHLQGEEYREFREEEFEPTIADLRDRRDDMRLFKTVQKKLKGDEESEEGSLDSGFRNNIAPQFSPGNTPDLATLVRFRSDVTTQISLFGEIKDPSSIGADYTRLKDDLEGLNQKVEKRVEDYIEYRFKAAEESISEIKGESGERIYNRKNKDAQKELMEARRMMSALDPDVLTQRKDDETQSVQERFDGIDQDLRDAYETAESVRRGREAIEAELKKEGAERNFDEAKRFFERVPKSREASVQKYLEVINLETKFRKKDSNYYRETEGGLNDDVVKGYRQNVGTFKESDGENDYPVKGMLSDIEKRIPFGKDYNPVAEIKKLLDALNKKRSGKKETKQEIYEKLDELVETAETYLRENGEEKLKRELASELGTKYLAAEFKEIGNKYLGIKQ